MSDEKPDNVVHLRTGGPIPEEEKGRPYLVLDRQTGLYDVVLDSVVVYANLDPVGKREEIRKAAGVLQPGDVVSYQGKPHTVLSFPRGGPILPEDVGRAVETSGTAMKKLHDEAMTRMARELDTLSPRSDVLTRAAIEKAVAALEANNIPPATCDLCGRKCYVIVGAGQTLPLDELLCEDCAEKLGRKR